MPRTGYALLMSSSFRLLLSVALFVVLGRPDAATALDGGADGRFEKRTSAHFVLKQDVDIDRNSGLRGSDRYEREVLRVLENAFVKLDADLGLRPKRKLYVYIHDAALFDQQFAGVFRFPIAGFFGDAIHIRGDTVITEQLVRTLYHELVHAALASAAPSTVVPAWLNEGLAEWFERRSTGRGHLNRAEWNALRQHLGAGNWIGVNALSRGNLAGFSPAAASWAYLTSYALVEHLAAREGRAGLARMIKEMVRVRNPNRALKQAYGLSPLELEASLIAELR